MKKCMLIALITIFTLSVFGALCFAQIDRTVTNTSKKGSLLVFPLIKVNLAAGQDTIVKISNDFYQKVKVKCYYRYFPCSHEDFVLTLTPNQPVSWLASTGLGLDGLPIPKSQGTPPVLSDGTLAELKCWAVNEAEDQQIAWNWLTGSAIVEEGPNQTWEYSAWRFAVNSATNGAFAGDPGKLLLTGDSGNYDACPTALIFPFIKQVPKTDQASYDGMVNNVLTLVPCKQDFVEDSDQVVYAEFAPRDENEGPRTGSFACVGCGGGDEWFSESLVSPKLHFANSNPFVNLPTRGGYLLVDGKQKTSANACPGSIGVPLLGVMSMQFNNATGPFAGETPTAVAPGQAYRQDASEQDITTDPITITWD